MRVNCRGSAVAGPVLAADVLLDAKGVHLDDIEWVAGLALLREPQSEIVAAAVLAVERPGLSCRPVSEDLDERDGRVGATGVADGRTDSFLEVVDRLT